MGDDPNYSLSFVPVESCGDSCQVGLLGEAMLKWGALTELKITVCNHSSCSTPRNLLRVGGRDVTVLGDGLSWERWVKSKFSMVDPVTPIITFLAAIGFSAAKEVAEAGIKEYTKNTITKDRVNKLNDLVRDVWDRLSRKKPQVEQALQGLEQDDPEARKSLETDLRNAMQDDPALQALVAELAQEIEALQSQASDGNTMNIYDQGKGAIGDNNKVGDTTTINNYYGTPPS